MSTNSFAPKRAIEKKAQYIKANHSSKVARNHTCPTRPTCPTCPRQRLPQSDGKDVSRYNDEHKKKRDTLGITS